MFQHTEFIFVQKAGNRDEGRCHSYFDAVLVNFCSLCLLNSCVWIKIMTNYGPFRQKLIQRLKDVMELGCERLVFHCKYCWFTNLRRWCSLRLQCLPSRSIWQRYKNEVLPVHLRSSWETFVLHKFHQRHSFTLSHNAVCWKLMNLYHIYSWIVGGAAPKSS